MLIEFNSTRCFNKVKRLWNAKKEIFDENHKFLKYSNEYKYLILIYNDRKYCIHVCQFSAFYAR